MHATPRAKCDHKWPNTEGRCTPECVRDYEIAVLASNDARAQHLSDLVEPSPLDMLQVSLYLQHKQLHDGTFADENPHAMENRDTRASFRVARQGSLIIWCRLNVWPSPRGVGYMCSLPGQLIHPKNATSTKHSKRLRTTMLL
jgi:hypothetical protein